VKLRCLQDQKSWIFMPTQVTVEVSNNGKKWKALGTPQQPTTDQRQEGAVLEEIGVSTPGKARYVRVKAKLLPVVPEWHIGAGGKPWIFVDEVVFHPVVIH
jgi:hypothetical protein